MGGMWAAGVPLALEHWPKQLRGVASGLLQGGFSFGFMLSSLVYQFGWPLVAGNPDWGWRLMLWAGVLPALVVLAVMARVKESPVWLEQQRARQRRRRGARPLVGRAAVRSRPAVGDHSHFGADGDVHLLVSLDHVLVSDVPAAR